MSSCIIIGAGMAGLSAAKQLQKTNWQVTILDKGRGVGGRMATRTLQGTKADHGAQFFSAKTTDFQQFVQQLVTQDIVREWIWVSAMHPRYIGTKGMNTIPKKMAEGLDIRLNEKVIKIEKKEQWQVSTEAGSSYYADKLMLTAPVPQVVELFQNSLIGLTLEEKNILESIEYQPCIAVMAALKDPVTLPSGRRGVKLINHPIEWIADNFVKGIALDIPTVTIHASIKYSRENFDKDLSIVGKELLDMAPEWIDPTSIISYQTHRWRYSLASKRYEELFLALQNNTLLIGGDAFGMGNVEGAYLSGLAMAREIVK